MENQNKTTILNKIRKIKDLLGRHRSLLLIVSVCLVLTVIGVAISTTRSSDNRVSIKEVNNPETKLESKEYSNVNFEKSSDKTDTEVGIWYLSWYAEEGRYIWDDGHGHGSQNQMLADVNGDGLDDAVVYFDAPGLEAQWYVALSNGSGFDDHRRWAYNHGFGSQNQMLADVNGDGFDDAVAFYDNDDFEAVWFVALSNGSEFESATMWEYNHGFGSQNQMLADVNGDGFDDAVAFYDNDQLKGTWYVSLSDGEEFRTPRLWLDGHGFGSNNQFVADVNGDKLADSVIFFDTGNFKGRWYVALSNGKGYTAPALWLDGAGVGSDAQLLGDTNGDSRADAVYYTNDGTWYTADSNGSDAFVNTQKHGIWMLTHSSQRFLPGDVTPLLGNAHQESNGDSSNTEDPVIFAPGSGQWRLVPADGYFTPAELNTWEAWDINYRPIINGVASTYDSHDTHVIDAHLKLIDDAGIDYLLMDHTNWVYQDYITDRMKTVCSRLAAHNKAGGSLKFAVAIGGIQYASDRLETVEEEAGFIKDNFVDDPVCGEHYYNYKSKPFLVAYGAPDNLYGENGWIQYDNKSTTNEFTVLPAISKLDGAAGFEYPSKYGDGCGTPPDAGAIKWLAPEFGNFVSWGLPYGTPANGPIMGVMAGWNNEVGDRILRKQNGVDGDFYRKCGWDRVIATSPDMVVINSFNEFAEGTGLEPADTSSVEDVVERWPSPSYYWDITEEYIDRL